MKLVHPECAQKAHPCFTDKLRLWRAEGGLRTAIPEGWGGPSLAFRASEQIREAKAAGYEPEYAGRAVLR